MFTVLEEQTEVVRGQGLYSVGQRVLFRARFNSSEHYLAGAKLPGTVDCVFNNNGAPTYRVRLDMVWNNRTIGVPAGTPIVVGNIPEGSLAPLA